MPTLALGLGLDKLHVGVESGGGNQITTFAGAVMTTFAGETLYLMS